MLWDLVEERRGGLGKHLHAFVFSKLLSMYPPEMFFVYDFSSVTGVSGSIRSPLCFLC